MAASLQAAAKTHKTAVCLVPPRHAWRQIQEVRVFNDKSFCRWPPHINLLYPFLEPAHFQQAGLLCREALRSMQGFQVTLSGAAPSLRHFEHGRSCTLWLKPEAPGLLEVQAALQRAFPHCDDLSSDPSRGIQRFTPHLSLGQWRSRSEVAAAAAAQAAAWQPLSFHAGGVALISREGALDPFSLHTWIPFGGGDPVPLRVPYVPTVGDCCLPAGDGDGGASAALARQLAGIGAAQPDGSVWNFAYGANMCPSKLSGARGLHPLESRPSRLPGWRLTFNHRGGMGTLQRRDQVGEEGQDSVHGVLHRLSAADFGRLCNMEHEYRPVELLVEPYSGGPPLPAVAFVTPENRRIADGLPPPQRYLSLLQEGAQHWRLEATYVAWLASMRGIDSRQRGDAYYSTAAGAPLEALPKIRTGSQPQQRRRKQRGGQQQQRQGQPAR